MRKILFLILITVNAFAQQSTFETVAGAEYHDSPASVVEVNNMYAVGGNTKFSMGSDQLFYLLRWDTSGQFIPPTYEHNYGAYCTKMISTPDGGFLYSGVIYTVPHPLSILVKISSLYAQEWVHQDSSVYLFTDVIATTDGNYLIAGRGDSSSIHYIKINPSGNEIWHRHFAASGFYNTSVNIKEVGDGYISCYYGSAFCVNKIDSLGDTLWTKSFEVFGGGKIEYAGNHIYISGGISASFRPDSLDAAALLCLNNVGDSLWTQTYSFNGGNVSAANIHSTLDGNLLLCSSGVDTGDIFGYNYAFMFKTDLSGNLLWEYFYGIGDSLYENGRDAISTTDGGYLMTGPWEQSATFLVKVDSTGHLNFINLIPNQDNFLIYPNPVASKLFIMSYFNAFMRLRIFNLMGELQMDILNPKNEIDVSFLALGMYFIQLQTEKGSVVNKFVKE